MQVILLEKVVNLGDLGDVVRVRNGGHHLGQGGVPLWPRHPGVVPAAEHDPPLCAPLCPAAPRRGAGPAASGP